MNLLLPIRTMMIIQVFMKIIVDLRSISFCIEWIRFYIVVYRKLSLRRNKFWNWFAVFKCKITISISFAQTIFCNFEKQLCRSHHRTSCIQWCYNDHLNCPQLIAHGVNVWLLVQGTKTLRSLWYILCIT